MQRSTELLAVDRNVGFETDEFGRPTADVATEPGLERPLQNLQLNATETVTVEGTTAVKYTVTGIRNPDSVPSNTATGHVTVAEEGFIAEYNITRGNEKFTRKTEYDLSAVGEATVARPAWMPDG